ncbi:MAG: carbohydrate-binding domain-containing protein, partial [Eubacteriales bacterium]|nr:carbohydrate-binding domain-containing protein [Eubacteriales bacterium]
MKSSKWKRLPALLALVISLSLFSGCGEENTIEEASTAGGLTKVSVEYSEEDLDATWDTSSAVMISLLGNTAEISGDGAIMEENKIRITEGGTYVLSGSLEDGQILIEADEEAKIKLVLNAVEIKSSDGPAIYSVENDKVIITIAKGTSNRVEDSATYTLAEGEEEPNAAIFSKSDLTINGSGTLVVNGNYNNGIVSKDDLVITGGNVTVLAVNDGIKGRDSIAIKDGNFTITAKDGDALQASNDEDAEKGWISIDGGNFVITATGDGLQAESLLQVTNGTLSIACGDDGLHADAALLVEEGTIL